MSASLPYSVVVGNKPTIGGTLAGGTTGSVLFINPTNTIAQDNANLFYDDTKNILGIGTATPNANAILDITSTSKAFMPPRMTTAQKNAIPTPTAGMVVYDSTLAGLSLYTTSWEAISPNPPVVFFGTLLVVQSIPNSAPTQLANITQDAINIGGTNLNTASGRFTAPSTGVYNLFCAVYLTFTNFGRSAICNLSVYNSVNVLQRGFQSILAVSAADQNITETSQSVNVNYTMTAGYYAVVSITTIDSLGANCSAGSSSFFGGSRIS